MKRTILTAAFLLVVPIGAAAAPGGATVHDRVASALDVAAPADQLTVIVRMRSQADLRRLQGLPLRARRSAVAAELRAAAEGGQAGIRAQLRQWEDAGHVSRVVPLWVTGGLSVTGTPAALRALASRADVAEVAPDEIDVVPSALPAEPNVAAVRAPDLWSLGATGQGVVVATLDSGLDTSHPAIAPRFRGGTNSWYDPYGQHATPYDRTGHGTWMAGVVVGGDEAGTSFGVAPGAKIIAARIWNDAGSATATAIHLAFQWVLDPDGNPATDDAPDVVNGSWSYGSPGCNLAFQQDLRALRSAGIVPVFAAGNFGPASGTSTSPANYPEALSVGAVDDGGAIAPDGSRGPSACSGATFPSVVAPGVGILTSDLFGSYVSVSGTSVAAPHVSGVLALLLSANPGKTAAQAETALLQTARDLGLAGPDNDFGNGLVDAVAAHQALAAAAPPPPSAGADAYTVQGDVIATIADPGVLVNDSSPAGLPLSAALVAGPSHGSLALRASGGFTYTPAAGYAGSDSFTYVASDGSATSAAATVSLTVTSSAPSASGESYSVAENGTLTVAPPGVLGNDADPLGRPLSALLAGSPANGTVTLRSDGGFTYVPRTGFYGADAFTYRATNGTTSSAPATVSLTVTFVNQAPVAVDDSATTTRGTSVNVAVLANDRDVDGSLVASSVTIVASPRNGSVTRKADGSVTYTPKRTFRGTDTFTYRVKDNNGAISNVATVTVQVM